MPQLNPQIGEMIVFIIKPVDLKLFPSKRTHYPYTGQIFLYGRGKNAFCFVCGAKPFGNA